MYEKIKCYCTANHFHNFLECKLSLDIWQSSRITYGNRMFKLLHVPVEEEGHLTLDSPLTDCVCEQECQQCDPACHCFSSDDLCLPTVGTKVCHACVIQSRVLPLLCLFHLFPFLIHLLHAHSVMSQN